MKIRRVLFAVLAAVLAVVWVAVLHDFGDSAGRLSAGSSARPETLPALVLWAWERPEDLRFLADQGSATPAAVAPGTAGLDPEDVGIAFLATTLTLRGTVMMEEPRRNPLRVPERAPLIAVARIEVPSATPLAGTDLQIEQAVRALARLEAIPGVRQVQVDFDATRSQRPFYRALLEGLRRELSEGTGLSITALASWCFLDGWIVDLPVDEAVPMLFRMGLDEREIRMRLGRGEDFRQPLCRQSVGIATDELPPGLPEGRRRWVFSPQAWTPEAFTEARRDTGA